MLAYKPETLYAETSSGDSYEVPVKWGYDRDHNALSPFLLMNQ
jgi:hypothetical protein